MKSLSSGVVRKHYLQYYFSSIVMSLCSAMSTCYMCIFCPFQMRFYAFIMRVPSWQAHILFSQRFQLWFSDTCRFAQQNPSCQRQLIFRDLLFFFQQILVCREYNFIRKLYTCTNISSYIDYPHLCSLLL
jgi:hypothetical protein